MKEFCVFSKLFIFAVIVAVVSVVGANTSSYDTEMVIAGIQEPPPSPPGDPDPPPPPPDPFVAI